eukprot:5659054-Pyramimonas_sp.AAC.1
MVKRIFRRCLGSAADGECSVVCSFSFMQRSVAWMFLAALLEASVSRPGVAMWPAAVALVRGGSRLLVSPRSPTCRVGPLMGPATTGSHCATGTRIAKS